VNEFRHAGPLVFCGNHVSRFTLHISRPGMANRKSPIAKPAPDTPLNNPVFAIAARAGKR